MAGENLVVGREPIQIVEIDQDSCTLTYGIAPCTAAVGVTGTRKCFNTRKTCQDPDNYDKGTLTLRFAKPQTGIPKGQNIIPSLVGVSTAATILNAGGGSQDASPLGQRASVTITFQDHPYSDLVTDKYVDERPYNPLELGTFWGKWLNRNPYYQNRLIRVLEGYVGQDLVDMRTKTYVIDSVSGPNSSGRVTIKAKDVLSLADDEKAQAPLASTGELIVNTNATTTTIRITGAVAADYPAPGTVRINDEVMTYSGVSTIDPTEINLTGVVRGTDGSTADEHDAEDRVQLCLRYTNQRPDIIANDLLVTYGSVPSTYIDLVEWDAEASVWLSQFTLTGLITEPTGVTELLGELTEQALFYIWWDEIDQEIRLQAVRAPTETPIVFTDSSNVLANSVKIETKPKERISQVWVFWGQKDPTESLTKETNYSRVRIRAALEEEAADKYGEQRIRKVFSRWLVSEGQAITLTSRLLARYKDNPYYVTIGVDAKDRDTWTGDVVNLTHRGVTDDTGAPEPILYQVIQAEETSPGEVVEYLLKVYDFQLTDRFGFWMINTAPDFAVASDAEKATGMWWSREDGTMPDNTEGYQWQ